MSFTHCSCSLEHSLPKQTPPALAASSTRHSYWCHRPTPILLFPRISFTLNRKLFSLTNLFLLDLFAALVAGFHTRGYSRWDFVAIVWPHTSWDILCHINSRLQAAIFDFSQIHTSGSLRSSLIVKLNPEIMGRAVETTLPSFVEAGKTLYSIEQTGSWIILLLVNGHHLSFSKRTP